MTDAARRVLLQPDGRIVLAGSAFDTDGLGSLTGEFGLARIRLEAIFADGFER